MRGLGCFSNCSVGVLGALQALSLDPKSIAMVHKHPAAWFFVGDFLVKLCFRYSFKQILRLFWVGKKVLRFM